MRWLWGLAIVSSVSAAQSAPNAQAWHRLVGIVQYLQSDYPAAVQSMQPSELQEQAAFAREAVAAARELGRPAAPFIPRLENLAARIAKAEDSEGVRRDCAELVEDLVQAGGLSRSPHRPPDLAHGEALFEENCAACHGRDGHADTEVAARLEPHPANFHEPERMSALAPYKAFTALTFGITNTPMPSFAVLNEQDRWDLAFFVLTLRQPPCTHAPPPETLETLAISTDPQLAARHGEAEVACLRRRMPNQDEERTLLIARAGVDEAMRLGASGSWDAARTAVTDAYLRGIEPVEPLLRSRDSRLVTEIEESFGRVRVDLEHHTPHLADDGRELLTLIDRARRSHAPPQGFVSVFSLALLILLREGFEASIVIAALLAVLKKMEHTEHARVVHAGWISATIVGAGLFVFAHQLVSGANRELVEGFFALGAVVMLVYAAAWLNARANVRKMMGELRERMQGALGRGSAAGLFTIAFTSVLRETAETAVFLQGLSIDSPSAVVWGVLAGLAVLVGLVLFIRRMGYVLPMKQLFSASTALLFATAVILLGQGLHALQEVGLLRVWPLRFIRVEWLGIFPDRISLVAQALLALSPLLWKLLHRERADGAAVPSPRAKP